MRPDVSSLITSEIGKATEAELQWYLAGAAHDATFSDRHNTTRFCQSGRDWIEILASILERVGKRGWIYREGSTRNCWVVETTWPTQEFDDWPTDRAAYARGYFDAEGGIPRATDARFYIQYVQKDRDDLALVKACLEDVGLSCGSIHNPSAQVDPQYWRFYVLADSRSSFLRTIGSWHPRKRSLLEERLGDRLPTHPAGPLF